MKIEVALVVQERTRKEVVMYSRIITLKCKECGADFSPVQGNQKYCSTKCYDAQKARYRKSFKERQELKRTTKTEKSIDKVEMLARERGLTYGQYVAMKQAEQVKVKRGRENE